MNIRTATFVKGVVKIDAFLEDEKPQVAFIGRSNVGKSSLINALTHQKDLARTSSFPGRTQEVNLFLINKSLYFVDLPGYGFAQNSHAGRARLKGLIDWYLFESHYTQKKVVLILDAHVGPTDKDREMFERLEEKGKDIIIVANKIDKIKKSDYARQLRKIQDLAGEHKVIPFSSTEKIGLSDLINEIL